MQDFEKLSSFYLGAHHRPGERHDPATAVPLLYDAKDLTTHALCVGMTGSGKTGLCVGLLEEAALDGVPALIVDPKGDMGNLLLSFPDLSAEEFEPWIDPGEATRKGRSVPEHATSTAESWREGLAAWGQDAARIRRWRASVDFSIYTPGSSAGLPLTVLKSFDAPPVALREDAELFAERIQAAASGLLALIGVDADPIQSREAILLSSLLERAWSAGQDLEIADLIGGIQAPPFDKLGVLDLDAFFPPADRMNLAMKLNGLLASPSFAPWMQGEPLDIQRLLYTPEGRPRHSILRIAHLGERERMFFVSILLNEVIAWMRQQPGTSSLRAILYMDEIFGYFPPSAEPPSKRPMLTLLKQARAFGVGCVLATQNPVDLDYKGLSNTGTWFLGRLQTERDKARVLDGLEGAMSGAGQRFHRAELDALLSGLDRRVFLMNNVHDDQPVLLRTRWVMSYLRGPLTREHIGILMAEKKERAARPPVAGRRRALSAAAPRAEALREAAPASASERPLPSPRPKLAKGAKQRFVAPEEDAGAGESLLYRASLLVQAKLHYERASMGIDHWDELRLHLPLEEGVAVDWEEAERLETGHRFEWDRKPRSGARYDAVPEELRSSTRFTAWQRSARSHAYEAHPLRLFRSSRYKLGSEVGESEGDFRARLGVLVQEERDRAMEKLRERYAVKIQRAQARIRKAEERVGQQEEQYAEKKQNLLIRVGTTILGALFGGKLATRTNVSRAGTAMRSAGSARREKADIERAERSLEAEEHKLAALEQELVDELAELEERDRADELPLEEVVLRPRKGDLGLERPEVLWMPWRVEAEGRAYPAWRRSS